MLARLKKNYDKRIQFFLKWSHYFAENFSIIKAMIFPFVMYRCDSCTIRNVSDEQLMVLNSGVGQVCWECLALQGDPPSHPKGTQTWIFTGRTDAEIEPPILWPTDVKNWLIRKDPVTAKDWRQEEKRMTEDEMVGWNHQLDGHEFAQAPGVGEEQRILVCCNPWGCKESEPVNWTECTI